MGGHPHMGKLPSVVEHLGRQTCQTSKSWWSLRDAINLSSRFCVALFPGTVGRTGRVPGPASVGAISSGNSANIGSSRQNFRPSSHRDGVHRRGTQPVSPFVRQLRVMTLCRILKIGPWRHVPSGIHHYDLTRPIVIVPVLA